MDINLISRAMTKKSLALNITDICNFKCKTCLREYDKSSSLDPDLLDRILPDARKVGYSMAGLTGGEPCLHPEFSRIADTLVNHGFPFNITSNGSLPEKYLFLLEKPYSKCFYLINFSLDGATAEVNDDIRHPGSFDKVIESIRLFTQKGIPVVPNVTLTRKNKHQLEEIIDLVESLGLKEVMVGTAIETPLNSSVVLTDLEKYDCLKRLNSKKRTAAVSIYPGAPLITSPGVDMCIGVATLSSFMINPNGEAVFCCNTIHKGAAVGSLEQESFRDLYQKAIDVSGFLKKKRTEMLVAGKQTEPGFNSCEFCNRYLADMIR